MEFSNRKVILVSSPFHANHFLSAVLPQLTARHFFIQIPSLSKLQYKARYSIILHYADTNSFFLVTGAVKLPLNRDSITYNLLTLYSSKMYFNKGYPGHERLL